MGSTHEMSALLAKRDARIRELEIENMELKSKLDKYQMIFTGNSLALITNSHSLNQLDSIGCIYNYLRILIDTIKLLAEGSTAAVPSVVPSKTDQRVRRINRGLGISAEPQSLKTLQELTTKTFPEIKKEER